MKIKLIKPEPETFEIEFPKVLAYMDDTSCIYNRIARCGPLIDCANIRCRQCVFNVGNWNKLRGGKYEQQA